MPLGDALALMFSAPLFTVLLSLIFFQIKIGLLKGWLCLVLLGGVILIVKPPFIFTMNDTIQGNLTDIDLETALNDAHHAHYGYYYTGVTLALGFAFTSALTTIITKHLSNELESLVIILYTGVGGIATTMLVNCADRGFGHTVEEIKKADAELWMVMMTVSVLGIMGNVSYVTSLKFISASLVMVITTMQVVLSYIFQG